MSGQLHCRDKSMVEGTYARVPLVESFDVEKVYVLRRSWCGCVQRTAHHHVQAFGQLKLTILVTDTHVLVKVFGRNKGVGLFELVPRFCLSRLEQQKKRLNINKKCPLASKLDRIVFPSGACFWCHWLRACATWTNHLVKFAYLIFNKETVKPRP